MEVVEEAKAEEVVLEADAAATAVLEAGVAVVVLAGPEEDVEAMAVLAVVEVETDGNVEAEGVSDKFKPPQRLAAGKPAAEVVNNPEVSAIARRLHPSRWI